MELVPGCIAQTFILAGDTKTPHTLLIHDGGVERLAAPLTNKMHRISNIIRVGFFGTYPA